MWLFNNGPLSQGVYSFSNDLEGIHSIAIHIHDESYFGVYRCEGELFNDDLAFYDLVTLTKLGKFKNFKSMSYLLLHKINL